MINIICCAETESALDFKISGLVSNLNSSGEVESIASKHSSLAAQEYIQEIIRNEPSNVQLIIDPPSEIDINVWQYEHLRQFILELNLLVVQLKGVCTQQTCPKMKATDDWLFLCAAHKKAQECSAIDYMIHNLD